MTVSALWLLFTVSWVGLQCIIVVFPDHKSSLTFCICSYIAFNGMESGNANAVFFVLPSNTNKKLVLHLVLGSEHCEFRFRLCTVKKLI